MLAFGYQHLQLHHPFPDPVCLRFPSKSVIVDSDTDTRYRYPLYCYNTHHNCNQTIFILSMNMIMNHELNHESWISWTIIALVSGVNWMFCKHDCSCKLHAVSAVLGPGWTTLCMQPAATTERSRNLWSVASTSYSAWRRICHAASVSWKQSQITTFSQSHNSRNKNIIIISQQFHNINITDSSMIKLCTVAAVPVTNTLELHTYDGHDRTWHRHLVYIYMHTVHSTNITYTWNTWTHIYPHCYLNTWHIGTLAHIGT